MHHGSALVCHLILLLHLAGRCFNLEWNGKKSDHVGASAWQALASIPEREPSFAQRSLCGVDPLCTTIEQIIPGTGMALTHVSLRFAEPIAPKPAPIRCQRPPNFRAHNEPRTPKLQIRCGVRSYSHGGDRRCGDLRNQYRISTILSRHDWHSCLFSACAAPPFVGIICAVKTKALKGREASDDLGNRQERCRSAHLGSCEYALTIVNIGAPSRILEARIFRRIYGRQMGLALLLSKVVPMARLVERKDSIWFFVLSGRYASIDKARYRC